MGARASFSASIAFGLALALWFSSVARAQERDEGLLEALREMDGAWMAALTLEGSEKKPGGGLNPGRPEMSVDWRLTVVGDRMAYEEKRVEHGPWAYSDDKQDQPWSDSDASVSYNSESRVAIIDRDFSGWFDTNQLVKVSPDGSNEEMAPVHTVRLSPRESSALIRPFQKAIWSSGRGFSSYIDKVVESESLDDGSW